MDLEAKVFELVDGWVHDEEKSFTAYNVTKVIRETTEERVSHSKVKEIVHSLYENGEMDGYVRVKREDIYKMPFEYRPAE